MSRGNKIALIAVASAVAFVFLVIVAGILVLRSHWFANQVRQEIVSSVERATGGRVEAPTFRFRWNRLHAEIDNFTLHGLEPAGAPPLLTARRVVIDFKLFSALKSGIDIAALLVDTPRLHIIVFPDGSTNIPHPATPTTPGSTLQDVVNLAIGRFQIVNGSLDFADQPSRFQARGQNLVARFAYNPRGPGYTGEVDAAPLILQSGSHPAVDCNLKLPLVLQGNRIAVSGGRLANAQSAVEFSGAVSHLDSPQGWAQVRADVSLADLSRATGVTLPAAGRAPQPRLHADITANLGPHQVDIRSARVTLGQSHVDAQGTLFSSGRVTFDARLALAQIARMLHWPARPEGTAAVRGTLELRPQGWLLNATVEARNFNWIEGTTQLRGLDFTSAVTADSRQADLRDVRLSGASGSFTGAARVENLRAFQVTGSLRRVDLGLISRLFLSRPLAFAGLVSGPLKLQGDLRNFHDLTASASLAIAPVGQALPPANRAIPLTGRLNFTYNGRADSIVLGPSHLELPHTRIDLAGSLNRRIDLHLVSRDLADLRPLVSLPVQLVNGTATLTAAVTGSLGAPHIQGRATLANFAVAGRRFTSFTGDLAASPTAVSVANAVLSRGPLVADLTASLGLRNWKPLPASPLRLDATIRNADLADVLALARHTIPSSGALTADVHLAGTLGSPTGSAAFSVSNGSLAGQHFDTLAARAVMTPQSISVPAFSLTAGPSHIDAAADYRHAINQLDRGALHVQIAGDQVQLANFQPLAPARPGLSGLLNLHAAFTADVTPSPAGAEFQIAALDGNLSAANLHLDGRGLGSLTAAVYTSAGALHYTAHSDFAGSAIHVAGQSLLADAHATTASIQLANLPLAPALALAQSDLPVSGLLTASAQVSGTLADPRIAATVSVLHASAWRQPFDRLETTLDYSNTQLDLTALRASLGPSTLTASASFSHPAGDYRAGQLQFRVDSSPIQLAQIRPLESAEPGLAGAVQLTAQGAAALRPGAPPLFSSLDASLNARAVTLDRQPLGDLTATAQTRGQEAVFNLTSDFAHSNIRGSGRLQLAGDYPLSAQLSFTNLTYAALRPFLGWPAEPLEAVADGAASIGGPLERPSELHGDLRFARVELQSAPPSTGRPARVHLDLRNSGPVVASVDRGVLTIRSARFSGPFAQVSVSGSAPLTGARPLNLHAQGNLNLQFLEAFDSELYSSGQVTLAAAVAGSLRHPDITGRLQLANVSLSLADLSNGISRASGLIVFNGAQAVIQNFTGESGGGKVALAGVVGYSGAQTQVRLTFSADHVWVEYPQTVTTETSARLALAGTVARSVLSGDVTILNVALPPQSDLGSVLTQAASHPAVTSPSLALLSGTEFDVHIRTASDAQFRTNLVLNLQAEANLTLRGTPLYPGMLGRILITQGQVLFFGAKYSLNQGAISFYDPNRIAPNLNIDLETTVQGIDVTVSVTGPMDRLNLTYRSDPPMQFSDLLALLTSGRTNTTDPVLAAHAPQVPDQSFQQAGASALFGAAIAQPVTGPLQRLFGVTTLEINPQIIGPTTNTAQATVTLQQQISPNVTLTYIQDIAQSDPLAVEVEWDINPRWSAVAQRDINGYFDLDFYWKKRFH